MVILVLIATQTVAAHDSEDDGGCCNRVAKRLKRAVVAYKDELLNVKQWVKTAAVAGAIYLISGPLAVGVGCRFYGEPNCDDYENHRECTHSVCYNWKRLDPNFIFTDPTSTTFCDKLSGTKRADITNAGSQFEKDALAICECRNSKEFHKTMEWKEWLDVAGVEPRDEFVCNSLNMVQNIRNAHECKRFEDMVWEKRAQNLGDD